MARHALSALLLSCAVLAAAHPRLRSLDVGGLTEFPADQWAMATENLAYDRFLVGINNGLADYAGPPAASRTVKLEVYFPPVVLPTPMEMPGWKADMYPCESSGSLQCANWTVVSYTAHTWDYAFNNSFMYNFPIGIRMKNDCKCNVPKVCEIVDTVSVPGVDAGSQPAYLVWIPSIQYTSTSSVTPDYAVFWTHNWDVWKGVRDNVRADMLLNFTDHPLYIWKNGTTPSNDYKYSTGRRAVKATVSSWSNCNYMEFNGKRIAVPDLKVTPVLSSSPSAMAGTGTHTAPTSPDNTLSVAIAAIVIACVAFVVGSVSLAYAVMKMSNMVIGSEATGDFKKPVVMDGSSGPM